MGEVESSWMLTKEELAAAIAAGRQTAGQSSRRLTKEELAAAIVAGKNQPARSQGKSLETNHGLSRVDATAALDRLPTRCPICDEDKRLEFDHHGGPKPHRFRGWLCHKCLMCVRHLDEELLMRTARYLEVS